MSSTTVLNDTLRIIIELGFGNYIAPDRRGIQIKPFFIIPTQKYDVGMS